MASEFSFEFYYLVNWMITNGDEDEEDGEDGEDGEDDLLYK